MIKKQLIQTIPESKKYIAGNVIFQWLALVSNIVLMTIITILETRASHWNMTFPAIYFLLSGIV